jgi:hypothetical protein
LGTFSEFVVGLLTLQIMGDSGKVCAKDGVEKGDEGADT